jgi:hypothetical protein
MLELITAPWISWKRPEGHSDEFDVSGYRELIVIVQVNSNPNVPTKPYQSPDLHVAVERDNILEGRWSELASKNFFGMPINGVQRWSVEIGAGLEVPRSFGLHIRLAWFCSPGEANGGFAVNSAIVAK